MKYKTNVCVTRNTARQVSLCLDSVTVRRPIRHLAFVLEHDAGQEHMVLQVLANPGQVLDDVYCKAAKRLRFPDARKHQKLRTIDGPSGKDHFLVGRDILRRAVCHYFDAEATSTIKVELHDL